MNAKELEKLTICRRCLDQQRCGVWADFVNSDDREEMEKEGFELAIIITRCPEPQGLNKLRPKGKKGV